MFPVLELYKRKRRSPSASKLHPCRSRATATPAIRTRTIGFSPSKVQTRTIGFSSRTKTGAGLQDLPPEWTSPITLGCIKKWAEEQFGAIANAVRKVDPSQRVEPDIESTSSSSNPSAFIPIAPKPSKLNLLQSGNQTIVSHLGHEINPSTLRRAQRSELYYFIH